MSVKMEMSDDCHGEANFELNQVDSNPSVDCTQLAVPVSFELKGEQSETCTEPLVDFEAIKHDIKVEHDIKLERGYSDDVCKPLLHIDVKKDYLLHGFSWQERDPLAVSLIKECYFELEEKLHGAITETVDYTSPQHPSGESATCQPSKNFSIDSEEPSLPKQSDLHETTVRHECSQLNRDKTVQFSCSNSKCKQAESKHYDVLTNSKCYNYGIHKKGFSVKSSLISYCRQKGIDKPFQCPNCRKHLISKSQLKIHCRIHTGEKPYQCHTCSKAFAQKNTLVRHCTVHTREKPYQCHTCSKAFAQKNDFVRHCMVHTGEKPYQCHTCSKAFARKSDLVRHCKGHTGVKPYQCHTCSKAFAKKKYLVPHFRRHTGQKPYQCHICNKAFAQKNDLVRHCRLHTGEKPYQCHTCSKAFSQKNDLVRHCMLHTGEKPYQCHTCSKAFIQKNDLVRHCRLHTGEKP